ncbi:MAG TPA: YgiT-type zinc finger protein [Bryobacteraceae bacterium]|jgi:YgiT-type zinc finger domain-containing protein|nr:YgiT-type zinc finger protein [Bryobacteraceae bacterium]
MQDITYCPTCGSDEIKKVRRNWTGEFQGKTYTIPDLEFHQCPACWERVLGREALQRIKAVVPATSELQLMARTA